MKTYAHKRISTGEILGIGLVYLENGSLHPAITSRIQNGNIDAALINYGEKVRHFYVEDGNGGFIRDPDTTTVVIDSDELPEANGMTYSKLFFKAFRHDNNGVGVDLAAAKAIAHEKRRAHREKLLKPHDKLATSPIASVKANANAAKQAILDADAPVQTAIDAAGDVDTLKQVLVNYGAA